MGEIGYTSPEEEGSDHWDCKSWDSLGKEVHEYSVAALVTFSQHAVVADIACATPATEPSKQRALKGFSGGRRKSVSCELDCRFVLALWAHLVSA